MRSRERCLFFLVTAANLAKPAGGFPGYVAQPTDALQAPPYFDCSNHPEWNSYRLRLVEFRRRFGHADVDYQSREFIEALQGIIRDANELGKKFEPTFAEWASSWDIYYLCDERRQEQISEHLKKDFCFYGFAVVQWFGVFGHQNFGAVPGMAEWAQNALGFLNDASKFNAMHFLESSGWPVTLREMAQSLSSYYVGHSGYRPSRDAALVPITDPSAVFHAKPEHSRVPDAQHLRAVAISYHTALIREPLSLWLRVLRHRFEVDTAVYVLDAGAKKAEDVQKVHSHCRFEEGASCASDEKLLRLNELLEGVTLSCHKGDHKTRHPFITDAEAYYERFVDSMGSDREMLAADVFLCGEPVYFCRLLSFFGKPVIGYISTPLSVYVRSEDRAQWYQTFYDMAMDPRHVFVVTTPAFGEWITYATGVDLPVVRPVCLYTEASYFPKRDTEVLLLRTVSLFWDSECVLNYFAREAAKKAVSNGTVAGRVHFLESTHLNEHERVGYGTFAEFLAAVIYPYAFSQFWFYELYAMGVPLFMPSRETLPLYVNQDYAVCPDFEGHRPGHAPHRVHPYSPFDTNDWEAMTYWTQFTDYVVFPHVESFSSVTELIMKLGTQDHRARSRKMQQAHLAHLGAATTFWLDALEHVSSWKQAGNQGGANASGDPVDVAGVKGAPAADHQAPVKLGDELRDLSTRQPCGGTVARGDAPHRKANDGDVRQDHPHEYHVDAARASVLAALAGEPPPTSAHWWVQLRRTAANPEVKLWARSCCTENFGHRLWLHIGNSSKLEEARECATFADVSHGAQLSVVCHGIGNHVFVEARSSVPIGDDANTATEPPDLEKGFGVLMLPEVRVLSSD